MNVSTQSAHAGDGRSQRLHGVDMPQREQAGCAHNSSVVAMTWWRKVHRMQLCSYPLESRRVPPAVVVEAHVGVDLDDQQWFGRRVVDQVSG